MTDGLTDKQRRFVQEYLIDLNATQAAIRAGYSEKTAYSIGQENLNKPVVKSAIEEAQKTVAERLGITAERVLTEYAKLAFLDIRKAFDENGNMKPIHDIDDATAAAITALEVEEIREDAETEEEMEGQPHGGALRRRRGKETIGHLKKVKLSDKKAALDSLAKHIGILKDQSAGLTLNFAGQVNVYLPDNGRPNRD
jgi:phage terminase small subunit